MCKSCNQCRGITAHPPFWHIPVLLCNIVIYSDVWFSFISFSGYSIFSVCTRRTYVVTGEFRVLVVQRRVHVLVETKLFHPAQFCVVLYLLCGDIIVVPSLETCVLRWHDLVTILPVSSWHHRSWLV